jgi:hypothetical protein
MRSPRRPVDGRSTPAGNPLGFLRQRARLLTAIRNPGRSSQGGTTGRGACRRGIADDVPRRSQDLAEPLQYGLGMRSVREERSALADKTSSRSPSS